jgi:hypothetical protein
LIRAFVPNSYQTADLYFNGNIYSSNVPTTCSYLRSDHDLNEVINYFTCNLTGDSKLFVESYETGYNGRILGYNDDYAGTGDFTWGNSSRVKKTYSQRMWNCFLSTFSSNNPTRTCDLYARCKNYTITNFFPNLNLDDEITSI